MHGVEYKLAMGFIKSSGWGCVGGLCLSFVTVESRRWRGGREGDESVVEKNEKTENNAEQ